MLCDVTGGTRTEHALGIERFVVHRKDKHRYAGRKRPYVFDKFQPTGPFQSDVYYCQIGGGASNYFYRLLGIFSFSTDLHIQLMINQLGEPFSKQRMVVDDNNPFFFFTHDLLNRILLPAPAVVQSCKSPSFQRASSIESPTSRQAF